MSAPGWVHQEAVEDKLTLSEGQVHRLLDMMDVLRNIANLMQVADIKDRIRTADYETARCLFDEFTPAEQNALWVAPSYGGIFTTEERRILKEGE